MKVRLWISSDGELFPWTLDIRPFRVELSNHDATSASRVKAQRSFDNWKVSKKLKSVRATSEWVLMGAELGESIDAEHNRGLDDDVGSWALQGFTSAQGWQSLVQDRAEVGC